MSFHDRRKAAPDGLDFGKLRQRPSISAALPDSCQTRTAESGPTALLMLWCSRDSTEERDSIESRRPSMLYYALVFLILGLVASALGAYGVAAVASQIAWVLFVIAIVLLIVHLISGRRTLTP
jgi:uncharacterized membrane protein YtjA (UPF0391 family)